MSEAKEKIDHPSHYTHPSGVECITITEHMDFNLGNAVKYIWRADLKADPLTDLKKAAWYINREIERRENVALTRGGSYVVPQFTPGMFGGFMEKGK